METPSLIHVMKKWISYFIIGNHRLILPWISMISFAFQEINAEAPRKSNLVLMYLSSAGKSILPFSG
jgi:hypothetical protein